MNIDLLKNLLTIDDSDIEVTIRLGWKTIAMLEEQNGRWFLTINGKDCGRLLGYSSKEKALEGLASYFSIDDQN